MSEVLIVLNLRRRSGVLAAAVAAVHRAGLEFKSQRMVDGHDPVQLHLQAEGELDNADGVVETLGAVSGVADVADVLVDGQSLLHVPAEPEPAPDSELASIDQIEAGLVAEDPWSESETAAELPQAVVPEPVLEPEPMPEPEPASEPEPESEPKPALAEERAPSTSHSSDAGDDGSRPRAEPTAAMIRRRRRRR